MVLTRQQADRLRASSPACAAYTTSGHYERTASAFVYTAWHDPSPETSSYKGSTACISTTLISCHAIQSGRQVQDARTLSTTHITQQAGQAHLASEKPTPLPPPSSSSLSANHSPTTSSSWQEVFEPCLKPPLGARDPSCQVAAACRAVSAAATRPELPGGSSMARAARRFWHLASRTWGCCSSCTRLGFECYKQLIHALLHPGSSLCTLTGMCMGPLCSCAARLRGAS